MRYAVRGQSPTPTYDMNPQGTSSANAQTYVQPMDPFQGGMVQPYSQPMQPMQPMQPYDGSGGYDPFMSAAPGGLNWYDPFSRTFQYGILGPQPYRLGLTSSYDVAWLPKQGVSNVGGEFGVMEANAQWRNSSLLPSGVIFSWNPEVNFRSWQGPQGLSLSGDVYRFGSEFEFSYQDAGPLGFQLAFTPSLVTDFDKQISSDGYSWDGRGFLTLRLDPTLMLVGGAAYWDRVTDRFIPYAGVVWTPDDRWEFRLLFPQSRASVFLGDWGGGGVWFYANAEYHVEAYELGIPDLNTRDRAQLSDYRLTLGFQSDSGPVTSFIEGGWILDRQVDFKGKTPDFDIGSGFLIRGGIRF